MDTQTTLSIVTTAIGVLGFIFGLYKHFTTRKVSRLLYEASELSDYPIPQKFLSGLTHAPVAISAESTGNKSAKNVVFELKTKTDIDSVEVDPAQFAPTKPSPKEVGLKVDELNPGQTVRIFLNCKGYPSDSQIEQIGISHSEGKAVNRRSSAFTKLEFGYLGFHFEYDMESHALRLLKVPFFSGTLVSRKS